MKKSRRVQTYADRILFGRREKGITLQKQMSRIIVICCVIAVLLQAVVMTGLIINSYVRRELKDTEFLLQSANESMNNRIQFLEERVLELQRNQALVPFFEGTEGDLDTAKKQLTESAALFAERNRQGLQTPFVTEVYLFNLQDKCIETIYYPKTVREQGMRRAEIVGIHQRFLRADTLFYTEPMDEDVALGMHLYDERMQEIGRCIVVLSREHVENVYRNVEETGESAWSIRMYDTELMGRSSIRNPSGTIRDSRNSGFHLVLHVEVSGWVIYRSLGITVFLLLVISVLIITAAATTGSLIARRYVRPLATIAEKIKLVGQGSFDTKLGDYEAAELHQISMTFNDMTTYINQLINRVYETQLLSQQAQIRYLQAQMDPHFLFNVLSMIELKAAVNGDVEVQKKISMLSKLLQGRIFRKDEIEIPLSEEMEIVEFYLNLQNSRFGDKITYSVHYDGCAYAPECLLVPRLSIEPAVENAVAHGLEPKAGDGHIDVSITTGSDLEIIITDDGVGFDPDAVGAKQEKKEHTGVGLANTDKMIRSHYGEGYGLTIDSTPGVGTKVHVKMPLLVFAPSERNESHKTEDDFNA